VPISKQISACFNLDNGPGRILGVYLQENAQVRPIFEKWMEPLGMTLEIRPETWIFQPTVGVA
jgi:hypothetical protein